MNVSVSLLRQTEEKTFISLKVNSEDFFLIISQKVFSFVLFRGSEVSPVDWTQLPPDLWAVFSAGGDDDDVDKEQTDFQGSSSAETESDEASTL